MKTTVDWTLVFAATGAVAAIIGVLYQIWHGWARSRTVDLRARVEQNPSRLGQIDLLIENKGQVRLRSIRARLASRLPHDVFAEGVESFVIPELAPEQSHRQLLVRGTVDVAERLYHSPDATVEIEVLFEAPFLLRKHRRIKTASDLKLLLESGPAPDRLTKLEHQVSEMRREIRDAVGRVEQSNSSALRELHRIFRR